MKFHSFKITQVVKAPRKKVYATWTDKKLARQFAAPPGCTATVFKSNLKVGGKYQTTMKTPHGTMTSTGEFIEVIPNEKIIQTFIWEAPETEMNVIVLGFKDQGKQTLLTLTGHGYSVKGEAEGNKGGWKGSLWQFANYFEKKK